MKVTVDGIYPAVQFHLSIDGGTLNDNQRDQVTEAIKIDGSGYVGHRFAGSRVIITSTVPEYQHEAWAQRYIKAIEKSLNRSE